MRKAIAIVFVGMLASCKSSGSDVQCADNTNCNAATGGVCRENPGSGSQWCSYPDLECPSGFRWSDEDVGDGVSGYCVDLSATDKTPPVVVSRTPAPDEPGASPSVVLSITFSEKIDPQSATPSSVQLQLDGEGAVSAAVVTNGESVVLKPAAPLDPNRTYKISVSTEVRDLAGNQLREPAVWGFGTREASWKPQTLLEQEQGKSVRDIAAASSNGVIVAAWMLAPCTTSQQCSFPNEVWVAVRKNQAWLPATMIGTSPYYAHTPKVAVDELGRAVVMWGSYERQFSGTNLVAAAYNGSTWSEPFTLERMDEMNTHASIRSVVADGAGGVLAVWHRSLGINAPDRNDVRVARYVEGTGWGPAQSIDGSAATLSAPIAIRTGVGTASAVWMQDGKLRHAKFSNNLWSTPEEGPAASSSCISLATYPGELTASWNQAGAVYAARHRGNAWESAKRLDAPGGATAGCESENVMHYLADGTAVTAWAAGNDAQQSTRAPGQDWGLSFPIEPGNAAVAQVRLATGSARALAMFNSGGFQSNEYNPAGAWKGAELVPIDGAVGASVLVHDVSSNTFVFIFTHSNPGEVTSVSAKVYE